MTCEALLSLVHVSKSYERRSGRDLVLNDVSLTVRARQCTAIWGQRGSGKTTLLELAAGLKAPDEGEVAFRGRDLASMGRRELARLLREQVGWARRAGPGSDDLDMVDYVALSLLRDASLRAARKQALAMLDRIGVDDCAKARWADLTDGERTLVSIAHAMVRRPSLVIADDPTANLDVLQRERVMALLRSAADEDGMGVLMTVPDMPSMLHADRIGSLSDGRLIFADPAVERGRNVVRMADRRAAHL